MRARYIHSNTRIRARLRAQQALKKLPPEIRVIDGPLEKKTLEYIFPDYDLSLLLKEFYLLAQPEISIAGEGIPLENDNFRHISHNTSLENELKLALLGFKTLVSIYLPLTWISTSGSKMLIGDYLDQFLNEILKPEELSQEELESKTNDFFEIVGQTSEQIRKKISEQAEGNSQEAENMRYSLEAIIAQLKSSIPKVVALADINTGMSPQFNTNEETPKTAMEIWEEYSSQPNLKAVADLLSELDPEPNKREVKLYNKQFAIECAHQCIFKKNWAIIQSQKKDQRKSDSTSLSLEQGNNYSRKNN